MDILKSLINFVQKFLNHTVVSAIIGSVVGGLMVWYIVSWDRAKSTEESREINFRRAISELNGRYHALDYIIVEIERHKLAQKLLICDADKRNYKTTFAPLYTLDNIKNQEFVINQLTIGRIEIESDIYRLINDLIANIDSNELNLSNFDQIPYGKPFVSFDGDSICALPFREQQQFQRDFQELVKPKVKEFLYPLSNAIEVFEDFR